MDYQGTVFKQADADEKGKTKRQDDSENVDGYAGARACGHNLLENLA